MAVIHVRRLLLATCVLVGGLLSAPTPAEAYIGPGAGFAFVSSLFILLATMVLAVVTLLTWPIRLAVQKIRGNRALAASRVKRVIVLGLDGQDPELTKRLDPDEGAERVANFINSMTMEMALLTRSMGKGDVHSLEPEDLAALTYEASAMAKVPLAGTTYIPGVSEERALAEMKDMMAKHMAETGN